MANRNTLYAQIFVDELVRAGLRHVVLSPGSRNTPLVLAFARHGGLRVYSQLDERSAAFFALGLGLATGEAAAIVCTSGSAAANYFPAIVEAHQSQIPLLVLTADRPAELRHSGANQTIDQIKIFGDYALWAVDAALPEAEPPALSIRNLRALAGRALALANGPRAGVVHINLPLRKPLEPTPVPGDAVEAPADALPHADGEPFARVRAGVAALAERDADALAALIRQHPRGLIVAGPRAVTPPQVPALLALAQASGYPILADAISGLRFGAPGVIGAYDSLLAFADALPPAPDLVLRFGAVPTSQRLNDYLNAIRPSARVHIRASGVWADDSHRTTHFYAADEALAAQQIAARLPGSPDRAYAEAWATLEAAAWDALGAGLHEESLFDAQAVYDAAALLPAGGALFAGNSLPIRHLDQFGQPRAQALHAYANRGASGIDGNVSTALGIAAAQGPLALLVGDVTLYHDMNGLLALRRCGIPATIVLLNNDSGGIFHRLPIKDFEPEFSEYFLTAHGLDFRHAAALYGLEYQRVSTRDEFQQAFSSSVQRSEGARLIEVRTDAREDLRQRARITQRLDDALRAVHLKS